MDDLSSKRIPAWFERWQLKRTLLDIIARKPGDSTDTGDGRKSGGEWGEARLVDAGIVGDVGLNVSVMKRLLPTGSLCNIALN